MMFLEMFLDVLTTRGHTWTWQCCYSVGVVSATICGQYVRWDMSVTVDDWIFHSLSLCLSQFSVYYLCRFVTVCTVKKMWTGGCVTIIFHILSIRKHFFRQSTTRKKRTEKSRTHLLRRDSDSEKKIAGASRWQIPRAVTSSTWQTSQLDKLTWQVDLHLAFLPLFKSLDKL